MKHKHGGHRDGAGRKPDLLKVGKQFLFWITTPDGKRTMLQHVEITRYDREAGIVELTDKESGDVLHLDSDKRRRKK